MKINLPKTLKPEEIYDICMSYDHSFGLTLPDNYGEDRRFVPVSGYTEKERKELIWKVEEFYKIISRTLIKNHHE